MSITDKDLKAAAICATDNTDHIPYECVQTQGQIKEHIELGFLSGIEYVRKNAITYEEIQDIAQSLQTDWGFDNYQHNAILDALIQVRDFNQ